MTSRFLILIFSFLAIGLAIYSPLTHYNDTNFYYGVTLRIIQGDFSASVDGMYSPLLSWLMAIPAALGVSLTSSFRIVNVLSFIFLLCGSLQIARLLKVPKWVEVASLFLIAIHTVYFTVGMTTADLLAASLSTWFLVYLLLSFTKKEWSYSIFVGLLGGLAYLAKAIQLPIVFLTLILIFFISWNNDRKHAFRNCLLIGVLVTALSMFWIVTLSLKYDRLIISGQQLLIDGTFRLGEYSPSNPPESYVPVKSFTTSTISTSNVSFQMKISNWWNKLSYSLSYLSKTTSAIFFGVLSWFFYLLTLLFFLIYLVLKRKEKAYYLLAASFAISQVLAYICVGWAPYLRYLLPALPVFHILFFSALDIVNTSLRKFNQQIPHPFRLSGSLLMPIFGCFLISTSFIETFTSAKLDMQTRDNSIAEFATSLSILKEKTGVITGNIHNPYPGYISYMLKREYWSSLSPDPNIKPDVIYEKLKSWNIEQVLWFGEEYVNLKEVKGLVLLGKFEFKDTSFEVYDFYPEGKS